MNSHAPVIPFLHTQRRGLAPGWLTGTWVPGWCPGQRFVYMQEGSARMGWGGGWVGESLRSL